MPELPEVESIVRQLQSSLTGQQIQAIDILWPKSFPASQRDIKRALIGSEIKKIKRRGKYICMLLENGCHLTIHLRMTGKLVFIPRQGDQKHLRVIFHFKESSSLYFIDIRKFGRIQIWPKDQTILPNLGPEPLKPGAIFKTLVNLKSSRPIKTLLLDQHILAGIGNIYADESLFRAGIHPQNQLNHIKTTRIRQLSEEIPRILQQAISNMGTTISDFRLPGNQDGQHQFHLKVYQRSGLGCLICDGLIKKVKINGRTSHFCPRCQPFNHTY